jgi:hypothetical protein
MLHRTRAEGRRQRGNGSESWGELRGRIRRAVGGLGQGIWFPSFQDQASGAAGDVDGDGKADLVAFDFCKAVWTTSLCRWGGVTRRRRAIGCDE